MDRFLSLTYIKVTMNQLFLILNFQNKKEAAMTVLNGHVVLSIISYSFSPLLTSLSTFYTLFTVDHLRQL